MQEIKLNHYKRLKQALYEDNLESVDNYSLDRKECQILIGDWCLHLREDGSWEIW